MIVAVIVVIVIFVAPVSHRKASRLCMCRVFEPRYRRLIKCCQDSNGCFALASCGVGITTMLDRVQLEEDSSNNVSIRGGRRFLVQEGSARVVPGTFGLTLVEPHYIYVSPACSCICIQHLYKGFSVHLHTSTSIYRL